MSESQVSLECERCGNEYYRHHSQSEGSRFCSQECQTAWRRENDAWPGHQGDNHPHRPKTSAREQALERDDHQCQRCGGESNLEVHHLIPKAAGGADHLKNLLTLCSSCHTRVEWEMKELPETNPDLLEELRDVVCKDGGTDE